MASLIWLVGALTMEAKSQCPAGPNFITQSQIDNFKTDYPGCTQIPGLIEIKGDISNLDGLSHITHFNGGLSIYSNALQSLDGLNNVKSISWLLIGSDALQSISGLNALTDIAQDLIISCPNLQSLGGFNALTKIGGKLTITRNNKLGGLQAFPNLKTIKKGIEFLENPTMLYIAGFEKLDTISGIVWFLNNPSLGIIEGFNSVKNLQGTIWIQDNAALQYIDAFKTLPVLFNGTILVKSNPSMSAIRGFDSLTDLSALRVESNNSLQEITGFRNLKRLSIIGLTNNVNLRNLQGLSAVRNPIDPNSFNISNNIALYTCDLPFICESLRVYPSITIANNAGNCFNNQAVSKACNYPCSAGDKTFTTQQQIQEFAANYSHCDSVTLSNLTIQGNDISDLSGLSTIRRLTGSLSITSNPLLTTLNGLSQISRIDSNLTIGSNAALSNLNGLATLQKLGGALRIESNGVLVDISGLSTLATAGITRLDIMNNPQLAVCNYANICAYVNTLPALPRNISGNRGACTNEAIVSVGCTASKCPTGDIVFSSQAQLDSFRVFYPECTNISGNVIITGADITSIDGLSNITRIDGYINIIGNPVLTNLNGLASLTSTGGNLHISTNAALASLSGLSTVTRVGGHLRLQANTVLPSLNGLNQIKTVGSYLWVQSNTILSNLDGLSGLDSLGGTLLIWQSPALTSLTGLSSLKSVGGRVEVNTCAKLTSLDGLSGITRVGTADKELAIVNNALLTDISAIANIDPASLTELYILSNPKLAICNYPNLCGFLSSDPAGKTRNVSNNSLQCQNITTLMEQCTLASITICPNGSTSLQAVYAGSTYQWQINTGTGYTNLSNGGNYSGTTSAQLQLTNMLSSLYGARFRCLVNGQITAATELKFGVTWQGGISAQWEDPLNWECQTLPDANTNVVIPNNSGVVEINTIVTVRSMKADPKANVRLNPGSHLQITMK